MLRHKSSIDDHIDAMDCEDVPFVSDMSADLSRDAMAAVEEFALSGHDVNVLEKAEARSVVDLVERANDGMRERLFD